LLTHPAADMRALPIASYVLGCSTALQMSPVGQGNFTGRNSMDAQRDANWYGVWKYESQQVVVDSTGSRADPSADFTVHDDFLPALGLAWLSDLLYPFQFEKEFSGDNFTSGCRQVWWLGYAVGLAYVVSLSLGTRTVKLTDGAEVKALGDSLDAKKRTLSKPVSVGGVQIPAGSTLLREKALSSRNAQVGTLKPGLDQIVFRVAPAQFNLKGPLAAWNLFLAIYSFFGAVRTVPHLLAELYIGRTYAFCRTAQMMYGHGAVGLWTLLFIYSKYFELLDTVFLVLRRREVPFLHWFHHFTVLMYCWDAYSWELNTGLFFIAMNYTVHAVMYFYYFLAAVSKPPAWGLFVTIMQTSQMVVGLTVVGTHLYLRGSVPNCDAPLFNIGCAILMYGSYLYLFLEFFAKKYILPKPKGD